MRLLHLTALVFASVVSSGCIPSSIYLEQPVASRDRTRVFDFDVAVVADPDAEYGPSDYSLGKLADDLQATGVFRSVRVGRDDGTEVLAVAREVFSGPFCGNPLIPTMMTLGVIPVTMPRSVHYDFDLRSATGEPMAHFDQGYSTKEKHGLIALPMRLSRKWAKSTDVGTPQHFITALRTDLLARIEQQTTLASNDP